MRSHRSVYERSRAVCLAALCAAVTPAVTARAEEPAAVVMARHRWPAAPWPHARTLDLPGVAATGVIARRGGGYAVGVRSPPAVLFLDGAGEVTARARLDDRPDPELGAGAEGRVFAVMAGRALVTAAPDGALRNAVVLSAPAATGPRVRPDGTVVLLTERGTGRAEFTVFSAEGDPVAVRDLRASRLAGPALARDGRVLVAMTRQLQWITPDDTLCSAPSVDGLRAVAGLARGAAMLFTDDAVMVTDAQGDVVRRSPLPAPTRVVTALSDGRVAALIEGPPARVLLYDDRGALTATLAVPREPMAPVPDATGALLVATRTGLLVVYEPDGRERWRMQLDERLRSAPVATPDGGVMVATDEHGVIVLTP